MTVAMPALQQTLGACSCTPVQSPTQSPTQSPVQGTQAAAGAQSITSLVPGSLQSDQTLVDQALSTLRTSATGSQVVDRLLASGAKINVISDSEFAALGQGDSYAFYDPTKDTMFLRRSDLADPSKRAFAAVAIAHEGTHLLDDVGKVTDPMATRITNQVIAAGGLETAAGIEARNQGAFEVMMVKEARAFLMAGQVARELGVSLPTADPTSVAAAGGNDRTTYAKVWERLLQSNYNKQGRTAAVQFA